MCGAINLFYCRLFQITLFRLFSRSKTRRKWKYGNAQAALFNVRCMSFLSIQFTFLSISEKFRGFEILNVLWNTMQLFYCRLAHTIHNGFFLFQGCPMSSSESSKCQGVYFFVSGSSVCLLFWKIALSLKSYLQPD